MKHHPQEHRARLRTRSIRGGDDEGRHLQGNDKNNKDVVPTPPPTLFAPTMAPTKPATVTDRLFQGSLSLEWSLLLLTKDGTEDGLSTTNVFDASASAIGNGVDELKFWIAQDFLCVQDTIWLTSDMKNLDSDCQATLRRRTQDKPQTTTSDQPFYPYRTILWNDPVVLESREFLNGTNTEYSVWSIQYPVYSYAKERSDEEERGEARLQGILNQRIENGIMEWEDGILAVVGNETDFFAHSPDHHYWQTNDHSIMIQLGPITLTPLETVGAVIILVQTIALILWHIFVKPCMQYRIGKKKLEKQELLVEVYHPVKPHRSHQQHPRSPTSQSYRSQNPRSQTSRSYRSPSSRTQNYDFIPPTNIAIPDKTKRTSGSSSAYPIPY